MAGVLERGAQTFVQLVATVSLEKRCHATQINDVVNKMTKLLLFYTYISVYMQNEKQREVHDATTDRSISFCLKV